MSQAKRPNVLLLVADQWRGDCLGIAGHPEVKTPYLDALAIQGARFSRAYSAVPSCIAARAALFTGMRPEHHGRVGYEDGVRWDYPNTLAGCFTQAGYQTQCVGKMHVHPLRSRQGFEAVELHDGYLHFNRSARIPRVYHQHIADDYFYWMQGMGHKDVTDTGLQCNSYPARPWVYEEALHPTNWVTDRAIDFLRRRDRSQPFFLMASYVRPHPPYDPPECYMRPYMTGALSMPPVGEWAPEIGLSTHSGVHGVADRTLLQQAMAGYYGCMTHVDHQMGRLMEVLGTEGDLQNTIVMFVSDHGEMMGDHHYMRKSLPYEGSAHVPMILSGPGIPQGLVLDQVMELSDVMPTLLQAAGLEIPDSVDGQSAMGLLNGQGKWREFVHGEHSYGQLSNHYIVSSRDKYVWFSQTGEEQYFDLAADPKELRNLAGRPETAERVAVMRQALIEALSGREEGYVRDGRLMVGAQPKAILSFLEDRKGF